MTKPSTQAGNLHLTIRKAALPIAALLTISGLSPVQAQECTEDADCDPDFECHNDSDSAILVDPEATDAESIAVSVCRGPDCNSVGTAADNPASEAEPQQAATSSNKGSQDQSSDGADADEEPPPRASGNSTNCDADEGCEGSTSSEQEDVSGGHCEPAPLSCEGDADCPEPTRCGNAGTCEYHFQECEDDLACGSGYACLVLGTVGSCSSAPVPTTAPPQESTDASNTEPDPAATDPAVQDDEGPISGPDRDEDQVPEADEAEVTTTELPAEPVGAMALVDPDDVDEANCETVEIRSCFPEAVECESDADCAGDWTCEEADEGPEAWQGLERICLPPGIVALMAGHLRPNEESLPEALRGEISSDANGSSDAKAESSPTATEEERADSEPKDIIREDPSEIELGTQGGSEGEAPGGCSTSTRHGSNRTAWLALLLAGSALLRRRHGFGKP